LDAGPNLLKLSESTHSQWCCVALSGSGTVTIIRMGNEDAGAGEGEKYRDCVDHN
jgi:hypothetical protein